VRDFIEHQRQHMAKEERGPDDWTEIDERLNNRKDPLFDGAIEKKFRALQRTILHWERETQANRVKTERVQN
jgi:hypothetical protein